ncbi:MAG: hypothetical protein COV70_01515 [Parcubacteria group bacterium CG11_big_fil_rev_8_21_14_0_20_39_22]|nr:MAG: hypothetical protein COV70_01515 [Parcubacteria group bacterium CG11_big_fil_rev_8_21_14_0_20_39_22]
MKNINELIKKIEIEKKNGEIDLSSDEDLSIAVMNLVSLEEHLYFTAKRTSNDSYFDLLGEAREIRKEMMRKLLPKEKYEGETWCATKHLLASSMRLYEVGTKCTASGKKEDAKDMYDTSFKLYNLFMGLRLKLISISEAKETLREEKLMSLSDIINKLSNCCDE